jgi:hypothetical protein
MPKQDRYCLATLRAGLLDHPVYAEVASVEDLRRSSCGALFNNPPRWQDLKRR